MKEKTIRRYFSAAAIVAVLFTVNGCSKSTTAVTVLGDWSRGSDFEGVGRTEAVEFTINDTAYIGSGYDGLNRLSDYWSFDYTTGTWSQIADMPGVARSSAVAFAAGGIGYVGTGYDGNNYLNDFYGYNPKTGTWDAIAPFAGSARIDAAAFTLGFDGGYEKGYVTCGYDNNHLKDLWQYDPKNNVWTKKASLGGTKRRAPSAFVTNNHAYVVCGLNNGAYPTDFWRYSDSTDKWTEMRNISNTSTDTYDDLYTDIARQNAACFVSNKGHAYISTGENNGIVATTWEYDPITDLWLRKTALEAAARQGAVGFTVGGIGYLTTGNNSTYRFDDLWKLDPNAVVVTGN